MLTFQNIFNSYFIHRSQYSPNLSQYFHLLPEKASAIIPPTLQETQSISASEWPKTFIYIFCAELPVCPASSIRTDLRRFLLWTNLQKSRSSSPSPHTAHCSDTSTTDVRIAPSHNLEVLYMKFQDNLMNAIDNYGQLLMRANYPGNVFLFRG